MTGLNYDVIGGPLLSFFNVGAGPSGFTLTQNTPNSLLQATTESIGTTAPGADYELLSGTNTVTGTLYVGNSGTGQGLYHIGSGSTATLNAGTIQLIKGQFVQDGGAVVCGSIIGGTYTQNGGTVAYSSLNGGTFTQNSGTDTSTNFSLYGTYNLSNGSLTVSFMEQSYGTFNQTGGTHQINGPFFWFGGLSNDTYNLSGTGILTAVNEQMGSGPGNTTFNQTGGTHQGTQLNLRGTYNLSGTGSLSFGGESLYGTFTQTGGSNTTTGSIGINGSYSLSGGTLNLSNVAGSAIATGATFHQSGGVENGYLANSGTFIYDGGTFNGTLENDSTVTLSRALSATGGIVNKGVLSLATSESLATFTQTTPGILQLGVGGTGQGVDYPVLSVSGAASLAGAFKLSLTNGFTPQLGNVFTVLNYGSETGAFASYLGLRFSTNSVLVPSYSGGAFKLTASTRSLGTPATPTVITSGGSAAVAQGATFAGLTSTSPFGTAMVIQATLLDGTASVVRNVSIGFTSAGSLSAANGGPLFSDVVSVQGTLTDKFVLQLDYNEALLAASDNDGRLLLEWYNGTKWVNAVMGDSDGGARQAGFLGAYNPATEFVLGDYGVDTVNDRVWAVIDHNSSFGVGESTAVLPEPCSAALMAFGAGALFAGRRRRPSRS